MGKLLDAVASQLSIRSICKESGNYINKDVTKETKELFKKEFQRHMYLKLKKIKVGETIDYVFGSIDNKLGAQPMNSANENLAEVLNKLPQLENGESYAFPNNSYIYITLTAQKAKRGQKRMKISLVSDSFVKAGL